MTTFMHARIHAAGLYELLLAVNRGGSQVPRAVVMVECPTCGSPYFANLRPDEDPSGREHDEQQARKYLVRECPDHSHQFMVS
jgi:hypothetical protein